MPNPRKLLKKDLPESMREMYDFSDQVLGQVSKKRLGRPLTVEESVHHINGNKGDNRPENLQLRKKYHGKGIVVQCLDCGSENIGPVPIAN